MHKNKLIEICCKCGFVHRDDRYPRLFNKQKKLHYHWMPKNNEVIKNNFILHATICVSCVEDNNLVDWKIYNEQRNNTPKKYYCILSYNATLPNKYKHTFDDFYNEQVKYFNVELET